MQKPGRNETCPCGSGKKYKQCCLQRTSAPVNTTSTKAGSKAFHIPSAIQAGLEHHQSGRLQQASAIYQQILQIEPNHPDALHFLGVLSSQTGNNDMAASCLQKAIAVKPDLIGAHNDLGNVFHMQGKLGEAAACYRKVLTLNPGYIEAHNNLGNILQKQGRLDDSAACYHNALSLKPEYAEAHNNLGNVLQDQGRLNEAATHYKKALELKPEFANAHNNLGNVLHKQGRLNEAIACFHKALLFKIDYANAHYNLGNVLQEQGRESEAAGQYQRVLNLDPDFHGARGHLVHQLQKTCAWKDLEKHSPILRQAVREAPATPENHIFPFTFLALPGSTAREQKQCTEKWVQSSFQPQINFRKKLEFDFKRPPNEKIHVAYLSADFRNHPVAQLMAEVFELHDRSRFHVTAYSYGSNDGSTMRQRLEQAFDQFVDIRSLSYEAAAKRIYEDRIDILVDLAGYTQHNRSAILALHAAPIQVNYLGYPGTMGADFVDYLIADRFIIPPNQQEHYTEKLAYLPDCYMPRDSSCLRLAAPSRKDCGLPDEGVVFCGFNQTFKITPDIFDIWCRLLKAVPDSVLWLPSSAPEAESNLAREAQSRGVAPERIIRAPRLNLLEEHLARLQCADLFLDTVPYNAHTTCSDALWMGLPVVTCVGETFPSRVAGSLLTAIGMPELITDSLEDYYNLALTLATDQEKRQKIRDKIITNRDTTPLFDSKRFTRNIETIYQGMQDNTLTWMGGPKREGSSQVTQST